MATNSELPQTDIDVDKVSKELGVPRAVLGAPYVPAATRTLPVVVLQPENTNLTVKMREISYREARMMDDGDPKDILDLFAGKLVEVIEDDPDKYLEGSGPVRADDLTLSEMSAIIEAYMQLATPDTANPTRG